MHGEKLTDEMAGVTVNRQGHRWGVSRQRRRFRVLAGAGVEGGVVLSIGAKLAVWKQRPRGLRMGQHGETLRAIQ